MALRAVRGDRRRAGKADYPLPMFVNAALTGPGAARPVPERRPAAPPVEVWRAGAPSLDFLAPDIYCPNFVERARRYRPGNPLFIPEAMRSPEASVNGLYAIGEHDAIGFSPFGIEVDRRRSGQAPRRELRAAGTAQNSS